MSIDFTPYLDDLERRIDEDAEARLHAAWVGFLDGAAPGDPGPSDSGWAPPGARGPFVPPGRTPRPPSVVWPAIHINDALADLDTMVLHQLSMLSDVLTAGSNAILNVRSNYGVSIMASQLGCEVVTMPREHGNLPTPRPLSGPDAIRRAVDAGVPDLRAGQGAAVFGCGGRLAELLSRREALDRWIILYHPDAQGPIDNADLAWGSGIFLAFYDTPELVHRFLDLMTEHYIAFLRAWFSEHPPRGAHSAHWGFLFRGQVMLRDDSLMNLSPEVYDEFIFAREERCLSELGGGVIHYCGRGSHVIDRFPDMPALTAVNLSQPHLNEMDVVLDSTVDRGLSLIGLDPAAARDALEAGRDLKGRVHCASWPPADGANGSA